LVKAFRLEKGEPQHLFGWKHGVKKEGDKGMKDRVPKFGMKSEKRTQGNFGVLIRNRKRRNRKQGEGEYERA